VPTYTPILMKPLFTLLLTIYCLGYTSISMAQNGIPLQAGARGAALGGVGLNFEDINSSFTNQAGLAFIESLSFTAYGERRFLAEGLNSYLFAAALPLDNVGTIGLNFNSFGFASYQEQKIGLAYARKLAKNFSLGVQFDYLSTRIPNYGTAHNVTFEIGILAKLSEQVSIAAHTYNPIHVKLQPLERLPSLFNLGLTYTPSKKVSLLVELEKEIDDQALVGKFGIEYRPMDILSLRAGVSANQPAQVTFGLGLHLDNFTIDLASQYHQILGITPAISLSYQLKPITSSSVEQ